MPLFFEKILFRFCQVLGKWVFNADSSLSTKQYGETSYFVSIFLSVYDPIIAKPVQGPSRQLYLIGQPRDAPAGRLYGKNFIGMMLKKS